MQVKQYDAIVVGGGLSGLAAGLILARKGWSVALFEKAGKAGGRAGTKQFEGGYFNVGPHALYNSGKAAAILKELGIHWSGKVVNLDGKGRAVRNGKLYPLPESPLDILTTKLLSFSAKGEMVKLFARLLRIDPHQFDRMTQSEWVNQSLRHQENRDLINALFRVSTYVNAPDLSSAGLAISQFQKAIRAGVTYLDGGWQTLVDRLRDAAIAAGLQISLHSKVSSVEHASGRIQGVRTYDGSLWQSNHVVLASNPESTTTILQNSKIPFKNSFVAVRAACLDLLLEKLPDENAIFALGLDAPLYLSTHTKFARLTQNGGELIHVMKYLAPDEDGNQVQKELEALVDLVQPGWRSVLRYKRFVPSLPAVSAMAYASSGGLLGRPPIDAAGVAGLYLCGDWIGSEGWLADGSLASAKSAASAILNSNRRAA